MASRICPTVINCECSEVPYANLSAELAEPYVFVSPRIVIVPPPLGRIFMQLGCKRWCYSAISQADADACALAQATECATVPDGPEPPIVVDPPIPPTGFPQVSVFATEPSTAFGEDPGIFLLSRTGSLAQPLNVQFTLSGEAQNGVDYDTVPYAVTIDAGDSDVEVIIIPMDTGEIISKSVILTVLAGSNYSPGASPSDTVEIAAEDCGTPAFKVAGYGSFLAGEISALVPAAFDSPLPEWDGILRNPPGYPPNYFSSNDSCYAINGKRINVQISRPPVGILDFKPCSGTWYPFPDRPECFICYPDDQSGSNMLTYAMGVVANGYDPQKLWANRVDNPIGEYQLYTSPICEMNFGGSSLFYLTNGEARATYGPTFLSVVAL